MTKHYPCLLYDAKCQRCSMLAAELEAAFGGAATLADLRDPAVRRMLDHCRPGWRFEPTLLVTTRTDGIRAVTGTELRLRLAQALGLRKSIKALRVARKYRVPVIGAGPLGVRPHPAATPEEIETIDADTIVRMQPDVQVDTAVEGGTLVLRFLDRQIQLPEHIRGEVHFILEHGKAPFQVADIPGSLDPPGRIVLAKLLLRERVLVPVAAVRPTDAADTADTADTADVR
jgi:hypothetical protein